MKAIFILEEADKPHEEAVLIEVMSRMGAHIAVVTKGRGAILANVCRARNVPFEAVRGDA